MTKKCEHERVREYRIKEIDINSKVKYGEKSDKNEGNPVRRLTFNPEFKSMVDDIFSFIQNLDK